MDEQAFDQVEMEVFSEWGVMCPHPISSRDTSKKLVHQTCKLCGCVVIDSWGELRFKLSLKKE